MKKIVGILRPFDFHQTLYIYDNDNKIDHVRPTLENLIPTIFSLIEQYNDLTEINLLGPKQFNRGIKKNLLQEELTRYNSNKIKINLL